MNHQLTIKNQPGFIALISVIILFVVLLVLSVSIAGSGYFSRFNVLESEYKMRSSALAQACASKALLLLAQNPGYNSATSVPVGDSSCQISSVTSANGQYSIQTSGVFPASPPEQAFTRLTVVANAKNFAVVSASEDAR